MPVKDSELASLLKFANMNRVDNPFEVKENNPHTVNAFQMQTEPVKPLPVVNQQVVSPSMDEDENQMDIWSSVLAGAVPLLVGGMFGGKEGLGSGATIGSKSIGDMQSALEKRSAKKAEMAKQKQDLLFKERELSSKEARDLAEAKKWAIELGYKGKEIEQKAEELAQKKRENEINLANKEDEKKMKIGGEEFSRSKDFANQESVKKYKDIAPIYTASQQIVKNSQNLNNLTDDQFGDLMFYRAAALNPASLRGATSLNELVQSGAPLGKEIKQMLARAVDDPRYRKDEAKAAIESINNSVRAYAIEYNKAYDEFSNINTQNTYPIDMSKIAGGGKLNLDDYLSPQEKAINELRKRGTIK